MCMYCYNSTHCVPIPAASESECTSLPLCIAPDGAIYPNVTEVWLKVYLLRIPFDSHSSKDNCQRMEFCTQQWKGENVTDMQSCVMESGVCDEPDRIYDTVKVVVMKSLWIFFFDSLSRILSNRFLPSLLRSMVFA
jgi:hypothetical protein